MDRAKWEKRRKRNKQISKAIASGKNWQEIADDFGLSRNYIQILAKEWEFIREPKIPIVQKTASIVRDFQRGINERTLARKYGVSEQYISQLLKDNVEEYIPLGTRKMQQRHKRICAQFLEGYSFARIAAFQKVGVGTVRRILILNELLKRKFIKGSRKAT